MAPTVNIVIDVAGEPAGVPGESRVFPYSKIAASPPLVTLSIEDDSEVFQYLWEILAQPDGVSVSLSDPAAANPTFTPEAGVDGTYIIRCTVNAGEAFQNKGLAFTTPNQSIRKPAPGETLEFDDARGYAPSQDDLADKVDSGTGGGGNRLRAVLDYVNAAAAPPSETLGDRYILDASGVPHVNWDGAAQNDVVQFNGTTWDAYTPTEGDVAYVKANDKDIDYQYIDDGSPAWEPIITGVSSVFGRAGNVSAVASDYDASQVDNDSGVSGTYVSDALDWLAANAGFFEAGAGTLSSQRKSAGLTTAGDYGFNHGLDGVIETGNAFGLLFGQDSRIGLQSEVANMSAIFGYETTLYDSTTGPSYDGGNLVFSPAHNGMLSYTGDTGNTTGSGFINVQETIENIPQKGRIRIDGDWYEYSAWANSPSRFTLTGGNLTKDYLSGDAVDAGALDMNTGLVFGYGNVIDRGLVALVLGGENVISKNGVSKGSFGTMIPGCSALGGGHVISNDYNFCAGNAVTASGRWGFHWGDTMSNAGEFNTAFGVDHSFLATSAYNIVHGDTVVHGGGYSLAIGRATNPGSGGDYIVGNAGYGLSIGEDNIVDDGASVFYNAGMRNRIYDDCVGSWIHGADNTVGDGVNVVQNGFLFGSENTALDTSGILGSPPYSIPGVNFVIGHGGQVVDSTHSTAWGYGNQIGVGYSQSKFSLAYGMGNEIDGFWPGEDGRMHAHVFGQANVNFAPYSFISGQANEIYLANVGGFAAGVENIISGTGAYTSDTGNNAGDTDIVVKESGTAPARGRIIIDGDEYTYGSVTYTPTTFGNLDRVLDRTYNEDDLVIAGRYGGGNFAVGVSNEISGELTTVIGRDNQIGLSGGANVVQVFGGDAPNGFFFDPTPRNGNRVGQNCPNPTNVCSVFGSNNQLDCQTGWPGIAFGGGPSFVTVMGLDNIAGTTAGTGALGGFIMGQGNNLECYGTNAFGFMFGGANTCKIGAVAGPGAMIVGGGNTFDNTSGSSGQGLIVGDDIDVFDGYNIAVGRDHVVNGEYNAIFGGGSGIGNQSAGDRNLIGGQQNNIAGTHNVVGGQEHAIQGSYNAVGGFYHLGGSGGSYNAVFGRTNNIDNIDYCIVAGWQLTLTGLTNSSAIFGYNYTAEGRYSIFGGRNHTFTNGADFSCIVGENITVQNGLRQYSAVFGGAHTLQADYNLIAGAGNNVSGTHCLVVGGGHTLSAGDNYSVVGGQGHNLQGVSLHNAVFGWQNTTSGTANRNLIGGYSHAVDGSDNVVGGWDNDLISSASYNAVFGVGNDLTSCTHNLVGGNLHVLETGSNQNVVGGYDNTVYSGGVGNAVFGSLQEVLSGADYNLLAGGGHDVRGTGNIVAGDGNSTLGTTSNYNAIFGQTCSVSSAKTHNLVAGATQGCSASYSAMFGQNCRAETTSGWAIVTGYRAHGRWPYSITQSGGAAFFDSSYGDAQAASTVLTGETTGTAWTELFINAGGTARLTVPEYGTMTFHIVIEAANKTNLGECRAWTMTCLVSRNGTGNVTMYGTDNKTDIGASAAGSEATWDVRATADTTNQSLKVEVAGEATTNIYWQAHVRAVEVLTEN